jgi:hypothetical protein
MPATTPDYAKVADAWAVAQVFDPSEPLALPADPRQARALARLRFAARVVRELGFQVDRLAGRAREVGVDGEAIAAARADHSPPELGAEVPAERWRPKDA